ncbi:winged helix-turn-helix transcriptional regulator [Exilibacterium tricleocarpae]|uniref:Leucine-responsive regulatory protein n=1 Tax=Exilibacterium tricleocarpae TaxID=2591008 RepID=A0A545SYV8_9GAMM|nr:winged helix-turn-helix transcriptional regulator [Exilibacterium tricleocarpae]
MPVRDLDRIDYAILAALQSDGRMSNVELSRQVNLSPSPCLDRVRRLEADGYIEGYAAKLNPTLLGMGTAAFIQVTLDRTTGDVFDNFRAAVVDIADVMECHMVAGGFDYLLKLQISGMETYRQVLSQLVDLPGVAQTHTYMVIEEVKGGTGLPIRERKEGRK